MLEIIVNNSSKSKVLDLDNSNNKTTYATNRFIISPSSRISDMIAIQKSSSTRINNKFRYSLDKLLMNKKLLNNFSELEANWNGYDGLPIGENIINKTEAIISTLNFQPLIFPTGRGTIQLDYFKDNDNLIEIEIFTDSQFMYKIVDGDDEEGDVDSEDIKEIIEEFYA